MRCYKSILASKKFVHMGGKNRSKNRVYYQELKGLSGTFASLVNRL